MKRQRPQGIRPWVPSWRPARLALLAAFLPLLVLYGVAKGIAEAWGNFCYEWREMAHEWPKEETR